MYTIEQGKPIPSKGRGRGRVRIYPIPEMEKGDSFLVPEEKANSAASVAAAWKKNNPGWDYTSRKEKKGVRFWRTA